MQPAKHHQTNKQPKGAHSGVNNGICVKTHLIQAPRKTIENETDFQMAFFMNCIRTGEGLPDSIHTFPLL